MRMSMSATIGETRHCITQRPTASLRLPDYYSSAMRIPMTGMTSDSPHSPVHRQIYIPLLCGYCWSTRQICVSATMTETLHCISRHIMVTSTLLRCYSSAMKASIPQTRMDRYTGPEQEYQVFARRMNPFYTLCGCCWTTAQMCGCATSADRQHAR